MTRRGATRHTHIDLRGDRHFRRREYLARIRRHCGSAGKPITISVQRLVVTAAVLLTGMAASARAQGIETVTNVPFAFSAGETNLPQDRYRITPIPGRPNVVMIQGQRHSIVIMSRLDRRSDRNPAPSMTFHRYGDQYFLSEVQLADGRILQFSQTGAEKRAAEYAAAQASEKSKIVVASK